MANITDLSQLDLGGTYSYADYLTWRFEETVELFHGKVSLMSPAPNLAHQRVSIRLSGILYPFFKQQKCPLFAAPFDVRLYDRRKSIVANREIFTVVQPDLCVICDTDKLDSKGCLGAPDWVIEVLSANTARKDAQTKFQIYQEAGVKEYWLVHPYEATIVQFLLDEMEERYQFIKILTAEDQVSPQLFPDLSIDLQEVFAQ